MTGHLVQSQSPWPLAVPATPPASPAAASLADVPSLTRQMAAGDEEAYREFYQRYFYRLFAYLLVLSHGDESAARESLQLTLLRVVRHAKPFPTEEIFWSWLTVLARTAFADEQRKHRRHFAFLHRFFERRLTQHTPPDPPGLTHLTHLLPDALASLTDHDRWLIEQKYFDNQTIAHIAAALGLTDKAAESRLARARLRLKSILLQTLKRDA